MIRILRCERAARFWFRFLQQFNLNIKGPSIRKLCFIHFSTQMLFLSYSYIILYEWYSRVIIKLQLPYFFFFFFCIYTHFCVFLYLYSIFFYENTMPFNIGNYIQDKWYPSEYYIWVEKYIINKLYRYKELLPVRSAVDPLLSFD